MELVKQILMFCSFTFPSWTDYTKQLALDETCQCQVVLGFLMAYFPGAVRLKEPRITEDSIKHLNQPWAFFGKMKAQGSFCNTGCSFLDVPKQTSLYYAEM
jgi:hypothetical protein